MKFFKNKRLTESIDPKRLDLEIVEGGSSKDYTFYIQNDHARGEVRNLRAVVDNKEIEILHCPTTIVKNESVEFKFRWNCDAKVEDGILPKFKFTYDIICGPTPG